MENSARHEDESFSRDYLSLRAKEAGLVDLFFLLVSPDMRRLRWIEWRGSDMEGKLLEFEHRWIIFASVLAQKLLVLSRGTLAAVGWMIELVLNLLANNCGLFNLLVNILTGNLVVPDRESATFRSVIWSFDSRKELQGKRNLPSLALNASKLAYENHAFSETVVVEHWKMEFLGSFAFWNDYQGRSSTRAMIVKSDNLVVVAFRGTQPFDSDDWCTDIDISWYEIESVGRVHFGFMKALGLHHPKRSHETVASKSYAYHYIKQRLCMILENDESMKFMVTGHSLGGALAILFMAGLVIQKEEQMLCRLEGVRTFGQPRVGDADFCEYMDKKIAEYGIKYERYVYSNDLVPRLPFNDKNFMFKHFGDCLYYSSLFYWRKVSNSRSDYTPHFGFLPVPSQVLAEEPNKNYFSLKWAILNTLNAIWELLRSFILPIIYGPGYQETWVMLLLRTFSLVIPGIAEHVLQDYDNLTRLNPPTAEQ
ncbi:hypothetical protein MLD38_034458 [Melastoma candidum]|uniref:Uncharacterized protein n=1 Tax=Melastoma candidum TaxID=119954 RepID=A0ACB9ME45_9MYRT|nr:hypothetical protein MLD38_034458 [Melastoma candidum]